VVVVEFKRVTAACVATLIAATGLSIGSAALPEAQAASCLPNVNLVTKAPLSTYGLPGGASVRIWDTGHSANALNEVRVAAVTIPRGTLTPGAVTAPTMSAAVTPAAMVARDPRAVVVINAGHFDPNVSGIPEKSQVRDGVILKATSTRLNGIVVDAQAKSAHPAFSTLSGRAVTPHGTVPIVGVNWQTLGNGISAYSSVWGSRAHPYGPRTVVVAAGRVIAIKLGAAGRARPALNQWWLTAPTGTYAAKIAALRVGDAVTVNIAESAVLQWDGAWPHAVLHNPSAVVGSGGTLVFQGVNKTTCAGRDENLRPRSAIGWLPNGDELVVTVSGRATVNGTRWGGSTVHQFAEIMRALGARQATALDGGTSTTLLIRRSVGGPLIRLDRPISEYQRPVVDALVFRA
jgi:hypothetical protein